MRGEEWGIVICTCPQRKQNCKFKLAHRKTNRLQIQTKRGSAAQLSLFAEGIKKDTPEGVSLSFTLTERECIHAVSPCPLS